MKVGRNVVHPVAWALVFFVIVVVLLFLFWMAPPAHG